jgi:alkanesulfonate monooxygenase SsuD/methylene tetrahydromethanopterin reductase-like flavin-dependent oxidoreductase (luciferase family)/predicted kinase
MDLPDPALIFLIGASGAGKSFWAEERYLPEEIVSSDRLRAMVGSGTSDLDASADAFEMLRRIAAARIARGLTTVVDTVGLDAELRMWLIGLAADVDLPTVAVIFDTPLEVCRDRNRRRTRSVPVRTVDSQHRRVRALDEGLGAEGWDHVVRVGGDTSKPPSLEPVPSRREDRAADRRSLGFVLHLSRFEWDEPFGPHLASIAGAAERAGFAGVSVMDHLMQIPQVGRPWENMPEALGTIGYLLGVTDSIEVGPLVLNTSLRNPALTANALATLDAVSGGRVFCGIGAGWFDAEETAYGYDAVTVDRRLDRLEDAARMFPLMWAKGSASYEGSTASVLEAMCYPRPVHPIRLIVGGGGQRRTLRIAAAYADAANVVGGVEAVRSKLPVLQQHCEDVDRDPSEVTITNLDTALLGEDRRAVADLVERHRGRSRASSYRKRVGAGTVEQLVERYQELEAAGVATVFVNLPHLRGPDEVTAFGEVIGLV